MSWSPDCFHLTTEQKIKEMLGWVYHSDAIIHVEVSPPDVCHLFWDGYLTGFCGHPGKAPYGIHGAPYWDQIEGAAFLRKLCELRPPGEKLTHGNIMIPSPALYDHQVHESFPSCGRMRHLIKVSHEKK